MLHVPKAVLQQGGEVTELPCVLMEQEPLCRSGRLAEPVQDELQLCGSTPGLSDATAASAKRGPTLNLQSRGMFLSPPASLAHFLQLSE